MSDIPVTPQSAPPVPTAPPVAPPPSSEAPPAAPPAPEAPAAPPVEWDPVEGVNEIVRLRDQAARYRTKFNSVFGDLPDEVVGQISTLTEAMRAGDRDAVSAWLWESTQANTPAEQWQEIAARYGPAAASQAIPEAPQAPTDGAATAGMTADQIRQLAADAARDAFANQQHEQKVAEFGQRMQGELAQLGLPQHSDAWNGTLDYASMLSTRRNGAYVPMQEAYQAWWGAEGFAAQQAAQAQIAPPPGTGAAVAPNGVPGARAIPDQLADESVGDAAKRKAMARMAEQRGQGGAFG